MQQFDVIIIGAGPAGLTLALLLKRAPATAALKIALVDQAPPASSAPDWLRVSALNHASARMLTALGAWSELTVAPYQQMDVWEADSFAAISFKQQIPAQLQAQELGHIVSNEQLRYVLTQQLQQLPDVYWFTDSAPQQLHANPQQAGVQLSDGQLLFAQLLVGADGANSWVRQQMKFPLTFWDYDQHALVAQIRCQQPHQHVARQVFMPSGPLALLPLPDPYCVSIVWSTSPAHAAQLLQQSRTEPAAFTAALTAASQSVLGVLTLDAPAQVFPLKMRYARQWQQHNVVLVADAAHTIHPLAGQGMNLGLMDVAALAELIDEHYQQQHCVQNERLLRRYERSRKAEAQQMIAVMEAFKRGFSNDIAPLKLLRAVGMRLTDRFEPLKQRLLQAALGHSAHLPRIAQAPAYSDAHVGQEHRR
jgi:2-octaprenylphenol hydroxylase